MSWEKRAELKKKREIAVTKRRITAFEKKIERKRLELEAAELEKAPLPSIPILPSVQDTVIIPEEKILEEDKPIFSPNPGPQTQFLAASEMEVLYGGAAGGELKSEFYCLLFS